MTVNTPDDRPLKLGDLADTDSPELVRSALARFRRRLLVRGLILALVIAAGLVLYPRYFNVQGDLIHDIRHARGIDVLKAFTSGGIDTIVREVGRLKAGPGPLRERFGMHLTIYDRSLGENDRLVVNLFPQRIDVFSQLRAKGVLEVAIVDAPPFSPGVEVWLTVTTGTPSIDIPVDIVSLGTAGSPTSRRSIKPVHIDLQQLNIPTWIWR